MFNIFRTDASKAIFRTSDSLYIKCGLSLGTPFGCNSWEWILAWTGQNFIFFTLKIGLETGSLGLIQYGWLHTVIPDWSSSLWVPSSSTYGFYLQDPAEFKSRAGIPTITYTFQARAEEGGTKGNLTFQGVFLEISCNTSAGISLARASSLWGRRGNVVFGPGYLVISNKIRILLLMRKDFYS